MSVFSLGALLSGREFARFPARGNSHGDVAPRSNRR